MSKLTKEAREWLAAQEQEFMTPYVEYFNEQDAKEYVADCCEEQDTDYLTAGYYARLSASGYLDCTDWIGPFDTEAEALQELYETYGD